MSLKAFHIVFIVASILLAMVFGGWAVRGYMQSHGTGMLVTSIVSFGAGAAMLIYARWFLRKLHDVSFL